MAADRKDGAPAKAVFWNDPKIRGYFYQAVLVAALVYFFYTIFQNTTQNLEERGIASGFSFLSSTAGFGIIQSLIEYSEESTYGDAFIVGLLNTLLVSFLGIVSATILGFIIGVARLSKNVLVSGVAAVYIEVIRNIPLLLQIFFWYFGVLRLLPAPRNSVTVLDSVFLNNRGFYTPAPEPEPGFNAVIIAFFLGIIGTVFLARWAKKRQEATGQQFPVFLSGLGMIIGLPILVFLIMGMPLSWDYPVLKGFNFKGGSVIIPELASLWLALTIYTASFIGEIVRSGIQAVSHGQTEAAYALGLSPAQTLRLVVIPQALRVIIPPLTSQYLNLTKNSSLAVAIAYPDLVSVFAGTVLNQTGQAVEVISLTMLVYLIISLAISALMNWYNKKMALVER